MLIATAITLILMAAVVTVFATVGESVAATRAMIQVNDQVRAAERALRSDLAGATASMLPPLDPESGQGYFEYVEGPVVERFVRPSGLSATFPLISAETEAFNSQEDKDNDGIPDLFPDYTAGDFDDVLMFTTRNRTDFFVGRFNGGPVQSQVAEVAWFMRGNKLYRRVLLVKPGTSFIQSTLAQAGFYANYDLSARQEGADANAPNLDRSPAPGPVRIVANSLGDLTKRENRYGHQPYVYPHDIRFWGVLRLPTLRETSAMNTGSTPTGLWPFPQIDSTGTAWGAGTLPGGATTQQSNIYADAKSLLIVPGGVTVNSPAAGQEFRVQLTPPPANRAFDLWADPYPWITELDATGTLLPYGDTLSTRFAEDVILNNVLSFDVKAWDPTAPVISDGTNIYKPGDSEYLRVAMDTASPPTVESLGGYVDLNYMNDASISPPFSGPGNNPLLPMVYDTWSTHYERDGFDQDLDGIADEGTDGLDNHFDPSDPTTRRHTNDPSHPQVGGADDASELEAPAPYRAPLRGIQVKIRVFEPDSRQVRELSIVHRFLPE